MAFHDVQFPVNIGRGARGGPERRTQVVALTTGDEERNASWSDSRRRYDVSYGIRRADDLAEVVGFFEARLGRLYGFRFKDWLDHKSCPPSATPAATDQILGVGNSSVRSFRLRKLYGTALLGWYRTIRRPVTGTVKVALAGVPQGAGWAVNTSTGIITFATAPGTGVEVRAGFEFDVPVRFDSDALDVTLDFERTGTITSITLIELREPDAPLPA